MLNCFIIHAPTGLIMAGRPFEKWNFQIFYKCGKDIHCVRGREVFLIDMSESFIRHGAAQGTYIHPHTIMHDTHVIANFEFHFRDEKRSKYVFAPSAAYTTHTSNIRAANRLCGLLRSWRGADRSAIFFKKIFMASYASRMCVCVRGRVLYMRFFHGLSLSV